MTVKAVQAGVATTERLRKRRCLKYSVVVLVAVSASFLFLQYPASKLQFRSESHHELPIVKARARRQDVAPEILDPVAISPQDVQLESSTPTTSTSSPTSGPVRQENTSEHSCTPLWRTAGPEALHNESGCGGQARVLCLFHIFNTDHKEGVFNRVQLLSRVLARPDRCNEVRFYVGKFVNVSEVQAMVPKEVCGAARAVDTMEGGHLGPYRERGSKGNTKRMNFVRGYTNRFEDTYRSLYHINQVEGDRFDWVIKLDLDTVFFGENFRRFLGDQDLCSPQTEPSLLGPILYHRRVKFPAGATIVVSRSALERLAVTLNKTLFQAESLGMREGGRSDRECADIETQSEDYHTAVCLSIGGVLADLNRTRDRHNREYFQIFPVNSHYKGLGFSPEMWYWKGKGFTRETANMRDKCCAERPVSFHRYRDLTFFAEVYEGDGATLPGGALNISRLHLEELSRLNMHIDAIQSQAAPKHSLERIHFPPPPGPPVTMPPPRPAAPPSTESLQEKLKDEDEMLKQLEATSCVVRVGWCQSPHLSPSAPDKATVYALANATFPECFIYLVRLNENGLWEDPLKTSPPQARSDLDILMCLGWFYDIQIMDQRLQAANRVQQRGTFPNNLEPDVWTEGVLWPKAAQLVPHSRGRPFLVAFNSEPSMAVDAPCAATRAGSLAGRSPQDTHKLTYDVMVDCKQAAPAQHCRATPSLYWPTASRSMYHEFARKARYRPSTLPSDLLVEDAASSTSRSEVPLKTRFCAFSASKCDDPRHTPETAISTAFFDVLSETYKSCTPIGSCRSRPAAHTSPRGRDPIHALQDYKFVIVFEQRWTQGYFSEHLIQAVLAGAVPIYVGDHPAHLAKHLNVDRIVFCPGLNLSRGHEFRSQKYSIDDPEFRISAAKVKFQVHLAECVDRVKAIDSDPDAYTRMAELPRVPNNSITGTAFDVKTVGSHLRRALAAYDSYLVTRSI